MSHDARPVYIFNEYRSVPKFHLPSDNDNRENALLDDGWTRIYWEIRTVCGEIVSTTTWDREPGTGRSRNYSDFDNGLRIRRDHAESFAVLCRTCARSEA